MNVFQMELIKGSDKKECQVCGRVNDPQGMYRVIMQSVCPCCKAKYAFIQISGIKIGKAIRRVGDKRSKKNMNLTKENNDK